MVDPLDTLAFSLHASPGVYALLLGSGVSKSANIPTGWEITLDLIRKLAAANGESTEADLEHWYLRRFDRPPNYSELINELGKTSTERQQLLRTYFESADPSAHENDKQPTAAHKAIAALVAKGFVRVIVTTNFDRLIEKALAEIDVTPVVISSPDQVKGALPLVHTQCCVVKLHGDYLDSRILNTEQELAKYPDEYNALLDQILDEFGLIVCGWSGEWDQALRSAIRRASSRRFTTYWATIDEPTDAAQDLIRHRNAETLRIESADLLFDAIRERVLTIDRFSRPYPHSVQLAVNRLKQYLSESKYRIRLSDLIDETVERLGERLSGDSFDVGSRDVSPEALSARIRMYDGVCETLLAMACVGGRWADDEHYSLWRRALQRLDSLASRNGMVLWIEMQRYPETLLMYALGLGALDGERMGFLDHILSTPIRDVNGNEAVAVQRLPPLCLFRHGTKQFRCLDGMDGRRFPLNDWIHAALQPAAKQIIPDPQRYTLLFDKLEILIALAYAYRGRPFIDGWMPVGAFQYRWETRTDLFQEIQDSLSADKSDSAFVRSQLFGASVDECEKALEGLKKHIAKHPHF